MNRFTLTIFSLALTALTAAASQPERAERRYLEAGNKLYNDKRYAEAEVQYNKALETNGASQAAAFNLAASLIRQATPGESGQELMGKAQKLLAGVMQSNSDKHLAELAAYNLGNIAYNGQDWDKSIQFYKEALRKNPDNDKARENLRLAQLKKQEQENQDQDQNQDQQNQDQNQDQQDQKDQQDDQNQDQQNQDQNQDQQDQQPDQKGGISNENAEKILKAMENEEAQTRRRVQEAEMKEKANASKKNPLKPW